MIQAKLIAAATVGLFMLFTIFGGFKIVSPGYRGVRVTLGKVSPTPVGEGLTMKLPWLTDIHEVTIRQGTSSLDAACFSADLQQIDCKVKVLCRPNENAIVTLYQKYQSDVFGSLVAPRVQEAIKEITATRTADQFVKEREKVKQESLASARAKVGDLVAIDDLVIENIQLTKELETAIEQKMVQEQEASKSKFVQDKARIEAETKIITARAEAEAISIQGEALKKTPDLIQLRIVEKWDGRAPLVVGETKGANIMLPVSPNELPR